MPDIKKKKIGNLIRGIDQISGEDFRNRMDTEITLQRHLELVAKAQKKEGIEYQENQATKQIAESDLKADPQHIISASQTEMFNGQQDPYYKILSLL